MLNRVSLVLGVTACCLAALTPSSAHSQLPAQGIVVHGHWVIEVRNPDGKVQYHREFENALTSFGEGLMAQLLEGAHVDLWEVQVSNFATSTSYVLLEARDSRTTGPTVFKNLTRTRRRVDGHEAFILQGSFVASQDASITQVETVQWLIEADGEHIRPADFTSAVLETAVPIQQTQTVSVTVTFTFS